MSSGEENVALAQEAMAAFQRSGVEAVLEFLDQEVECHTAPELGGGEFHGHEGYRQWVGQWAESFEELTIEISNLEAVGKRHVVGDMLQTGRGRASGVPVELRLAFMSEARNGKAVRYHLYPDREAAIAAATKVEVG